MKQPHVIILHTDQQRWDSLGYNGNPHAVTPHLDALAKAGTNFMRHIAASPICMPSRASLMTGLYPGSHGVWANGIPLNRREYLHYRDMTDFGDPPSVAEPETMADYFATQGYCTAAFGKLHLRPGHVATHETHPESNHGWSSGTFAHWRGPYYGFDHVQLTHGHGASPCLSGHYADWLKQHHPEVYQRVKANEADKPLLIPHQGDAYTLPMDPALHHSRWVVDRALEHIQRQGQERQQKPTFSFIGFADPHHSFTPCESTWEQFNDQPVSDPVDPDGHHWQQVVGHQLYKPPSQVSHLSLEDKRVLRRATLAMEHQIDNAIGHLVTSLKELQLWDNTIIVFTSDHGDFLGDHNLLYKEVMGSRALMHVPLIVRAPQSPWPDTVHTPNSNVDIFATLASLCHLEPPQTQGVPLDKTLNEDMVLSQCHNSIREDNNYSGFTQQHRITWYPNRDVIELYDHRTDPGENHNLADRETALTQALLDQLKTLIIQSTNPIGGRVAVW